MTSQRSLSITTYDRVKRLGDVLVAGGALAILSPVMLGTALLVRVKLGRNVLFRQERPGVDGQVFEILKFRTMLDPDPTRGLMSDAERMTPFGDRLRATSLDELPSLLNVLRGEMSLVGPRPLRTWYLDRYSHEQARRHEVLPGLTGLAQISGRNALSWDDRLDLDVHYVETRSLLVDLSILFGTIPKVFRREGISEEGQATRSDFFGPRRLGPYEIRPADEHSDGRLWDVLDRSTGTVLARCGIAPAANGAADVDIMVAPTAGEQDLIRRRAIEMLAGIGRELGLQQLRVATPPDGSVRSFDLSRSAAGGKVTEHDSSAVLTSSLERGRGA
ncbi:sugar transferase [Brachybacterium vulturis]|uniref:sugar transferase n=1 Tax=Brachybacterium vulturis TaxID=2017484 RepID=UPI003735F5A9